MKIMITGSSGMIGQALVKTLVPMHQLILVGRNKSLLKKKFSVCQFLSWEELPYFSEDIDVIIHLSGENIANNRWTASVKSKIIHSRVDTALQLLNWVKGRKIKPRILATNAIGYYGFSEKAMDEDTIIDEQHPQSFSQQVAFAWQNVWKNSELNLSICWMRFGVVLQKNKGMLKKLGIPFYLGLGTIVGSGEQQISWIQIDDLVNAIHWLLDHPDIQGPMNLVAPNPVAQEKFAQALAQVLNRPLWLNMPKPLVRCLFGQMGEELLLSGQRIYPKRLLASGFTFQYPTINEALMHEFNPSDVF